MIEEMKARASRIPDDRMQDVYNAILEDANTSQKVGVKHILDACKKLGISTRDYSSQYVEIKDWTCGCCEHEFKYHPLPTAAQQVDRDWHSVCPRCGFQVNWTITRNNYMAMGAGEPEWYPKLVTRYRDSAQAYGPGKQHGIFFKRAQIAKELQEEEQDSQPLKTTEQLRQEVRAIADAKRYG
jgi:hypothetical protein